MSNDRDMIARTQSRARGIMGRELSADEMATEFAKYPLNERIDILEDLGADQKTYSSVREAAKDHSYQSALFAIHEKLRKIDR